MFGGALFFGRDIARRVIKEIRALCPDSERFFRARVQTFMSQPNQILRRPGHILTNISPPPPSSSCFLILWLFNNQPIYGWLHLAGRVAIRKGNYRQSVTSSTAVCCRVCGLIGSVTRDLTELRCRNFAQVSSAEHRGQLHVLPKRPSVVISDDDDHNKLYIRSGSNQENQVTQLAVAAA